MPDAAPASDGLTLRVATYNVERDRPSGIVLAEVTRLSEAADVLLLQECNGYLPALQKVPGFQWVAFSAAAEQHESMILVRDGIKITASRAVKVTTAGWTTATGHRTPPKWATVATIAGVEFWSLHTAPTQQPSAKRLAARARARSYDELMHSLPTSGRCVIGADWNVTPTGTGAATFPKRFFPTIGLTLHAPDAGTHGSRTIDYFATKGVRMSNVHVVSGNWGSDHKPVVGDVTL